MPKKTGHEPAIAKDPEDLAPALGGSSFYVEIRKGDGEPLRRVVDAASGEEALRIVERWILDTELNRRVECYVRVTANRENLGQPIGLYVPLEQFTPDGLTLERAKNRDPGNRFVASCAAFLQRNGYLSAKQIAALEKVTQTQGRRRRDLAGPPGSWSTWGDDDYGPINRSRDQYAADFSDDDYAFDGGIDGWGN